MNPTLYVILLFLDCFTLILIGVILGHFFWPGDK